MTDTNANAVPRADAPDSPSFSVRRAGAGDAGALAAVAAATFPLACPPDAKPEAIQDFIAHHLTETSFDGYLADPARELYLVEVDSVAAGYTMLVFGEPADPDVLAVVTARPVAELSKVYVLPEHHGLGLAQTLVAASIDAAAARGVKALWLGVNEHNAKANRFYEKVGFVTVGNKKFLVGQRWEDDFVKVRVLA